MKHVLKQGEITELLSDSGEGGWSKEAHLVTHNRKKYMLRKTKTFARAKKYELLSKKFEKDGFLPKFLGRYGKNVLYEYIEGRDLKKKEPLEVIKQIGKISGQINKINSKENVNLRFYKQVKEATTGKFNRTILDYRPLLSKKKVKPLLTREKSKSILKLYKFLKEKSRAKTKLDMNDATPENFRLRKGKVYFVDIEAIKPRIKAYVIGKAFTKWFKSERERKAFLEGYNSVLSNKFLNEYHLDLVYLTYLVQDINYACKFGKKYKTKYKLRLEFLDNILKKYQEILK